MEGMNSVYKTFVMLVVIIAVITIYISQQEVRDVPKLDENSTPLLGGDRDSHGCIPSAGYRWCDALQKCIRPWEENCTAAVLP